MKKTLALLLSLLLLLSASASFADTPTDGFDPERVAAGVAALANSQLGNTVTVEASDTVGMYSVYYQGEYMGGYLYFNHLDREGNAQDEGVCNHAAFLEIFTYDAGTASSYVAFWLGLSAYLLQYITGTEDHNVPATELADAASEAMKNGGQYRFSEGDYDIEVTVASSNGTVMMGTSVTVRDLF